MTTVTRLFAALVADLPESLREQALFDEAREANAADIVRVLTILHTTYVAGRVNPALRQFTDPVFIRVEAGELPGDSWAEAIAHNH